MADVAPRWLLILSLALLRCGPAHPHLFRVASREGFEIRCTPSPQETVAVLGQVERPAAVPAEQARTIGEALRAAGGVLRDATTVRVYSCDSSAHGQVHVGDVRSLSDMERSTPLSPGSIVFVDTTRD